MARGHFHPSRCKVCGRHESEVGPISQKGFCIEHGMEALVSNIVQMRARSGPNFAKWRQRMAASVGAVLIEDRQP